MLSLILELVSKKAVQSCNGRHEKNWLPKNYEKRCLTAYYENIKLASIKFLW